MDASTRKEVKQLNLGGGAAGILVALDGSRAYVAVSTSDKVAVVDLKTLEVVGQIFAGKQPDGLAWAVRK
jgi:YVTN family beta-propeller protein